MTGNERRYLTRVERRANRAWRLYVVGFMCLTGAAAFSVLSALCWAGVVAACRAVAW